MYPLVASPSIEIVCRSLKDSADKTSSPYRKMVYKVRIVLFKCLGTSGFGMKGGAKSCKGKTIKYTSNALAGTATLLLSLASLGGFAYYDYRCRQKDRNKVMPIQAINLSPVLPSTPRNGSKSAPTIETL